MKKIVSTLMTVAMLVGVSFAQTATKTAKAKLTQAAKTAEVSTEKKSTEASAPLTGAAQFTKTTHSFGKIPQNKPVTTEFSFVNKSTKPLIIDNATAECGCTTPEYPKTPIGKGKTGKIKVTYNAANPGAFTKKVTVKIAGQDMPVILTIEGEVETAKK